MQAICNGCLWRIILGCQRTLDKKCCQQPGLKSFIIYLPSLYKRALCRGWAIPNLSPLDFCLLVRVICSDFALLILTTFSPDKLGYGSAIGALLVENAQRFAEKRIHEKGLLFLSRIYPVIRLNTSPLFIYLKYSYTSIPFSVQGQEHIVPANLLKNYFLQVI